MIFETMMERISKEVNVGDILMRLAAGKVETSPFAEALISEGRDIWFSILKTYGADDTNLGRIATGQPLYLNAVGSHLQLIGDPD